MGETKQVQKALIEKTQVELYKKEILYHKFRMEIHNKYSEWKERIFEKEWIRCLKSNGLWFYNTQTELLIPVLPRYNTEHESYGGLRCCNVSEEEAVLMFGNEKRIPKEIRKGIENTSSRTYANNCLMNAENYFTIKFSYAYYGGTQNIYISENCDYTDVEKERDGEILEVASKAYQLDYMTENGKCHYIVEGSFLIGNGK